MTEKEFREILKRVDRLVEKAKKERLSHSEIVELENLLKAAEEYNEEFTYRENLHMLFQTRNKIIIKSSS